MVINRLKASVKFNTIYTCETCGKGMVGDTVNLRFDGWSSEELKQFIDNTKQDSAHMPIGWSYNGKFNCGCAKNNTRT